MAESKIDFSFENLHFSCEGDRDWVEKQLNMVLSRIPGLNQTATAEVVEEVIEEEQLEREEPKATAKRTRKAKAAVVAEPTNHDPLYQFLVDKKADKNQVRKFLATAVYQYAREGVEKFSTPMISKSLKAVNIEKLINASDCLNKNEKKGFCIKEDKEFVLTEAGIKSILGNEE